MSVTLRGRDATRRMVADSPVAEWGGEGRIQSRTNEKGRTRPAPWFFFLRPSGRDAARLLALHYLLHEDAMALRKLEGMAGAGV
jgi:hypothetical protein